jgi:hypothetical protein
MLYVQINAAFRAEGMSIRLKPTMRAARLAANRRSALKSTATHGVGQAPVKLECATHGKAVQQREAVLRRF